MGIFITEIKSVPTSAALGSLLISSVREFSLRRPLDMEACDHLHAHQQGSVRRGHSLDPGDRAQCLFQPRVQSYVFRGWIAQAGRIYLEEDEMIDRKAWIDPIEVDERSKKEPRCDDQHRDTAI